MKNLLGIFLALMLFAIPASARNHGGSKGGGVRGVGGGHIPARGPAPHPGPAPAARPAPARQESRPAQEQSRPAQEQARSYSDKKGHPDAPHVHSSGDKNGLGMIPGEMIPTTTSIIPGSTADLRAVLAGGMCFASKEEARAASGSAASIFRLRHMISAIAATGSGVLTA